MRLTPVDYDTLQASWITREIADAAGVFRAAHLDAKELLVRRNGGGDLSGLVFPYYWPGDPHVLMHRVRLDTPLPKADGKPLKYLCAANQRQHLYIPPGCPPALLSDISKPVIFTEGEKKALSLWHYSLEKGTAVLPVAAGGVWNWHGPTGTETDEKGSRYTVHSPLPDLDRIAWKGRKVIILFDANAAVNPNVSWARRKLASELMHRGARVLIANLPKETGINGCDDYLAKHGPEKLDGVLDAALPYDWRAELIRTDKDKPAACFANAVTALRWAPEWAGVLAWDEFAMVPAALRPPPWGTVKSWSDQEDRRACEWLQHNGIGVKIHEAGAAVQTVAHDQPFHPVRRYFASLTWDGTPRAETWLSGYLGVQRSKYTDAVGVKWLISVVARVMEPGCKADHALILEGPQGIFKSTVFAVLGGEWYTDDVADLQSKDAPLGTRGKLIIEFSELDVISKAEKSRVKAFLSRATDHFRVPYEKRAGDYPRECIFAGTTNTEQWMQDETGGRRFWPAKAGTIDIDKLRRDRDQLWAEACKLYYDGVPWWMDSAELTALAEEEQAQRYDSDPWEAAVLKWCAAPLQCFRRDRPGDPETPVEPFTSEPGSVILEEILLHCIGKPLDRHEPRDKNRLIRILRASGWARGWKRNGDCSQRCWQKECLQSRTPKSAKAGKA